MSDLATSIAALREAMDEGKISVEDAEDMGYFTARVWAKQVTGRDPNTESVKLKRLYDRGTLERVAVLPKGFAYRAKGG